MATRIFKGELEIDHARGVIYFHAHDPKTIERFRTVTLLRVCSLPTPIPQDSQIDITHGVGAFYVRPESE